MKKLKGIPRAKPAARMMAVPTRIVPTVLFIILLIMYSFY
jgi:hypothetical protein